MLIRKLGILGLEVTELYGVEPWAVDHLNPLGLIFCYLCTEATEQGEEDRNEFDITDSDAEDIWFAHQLSNDACASQAILNVVLNCRNVDMGPDIRHFRQDTLKMNSVVSSQ